MNTRVESVSIGDAAQSAGGIWYRLHSEQEEISEALIQEPWPSHQFRAVVGDTRDARQLQQRLRLVVDALDRLMAGSYGSCIKCGRRIEEAKLVADPATAVCHQCGERLPTLH